MSLYQHTGSEFRDRSRSRAKDLLRRYPLRAGVAATVGVAGLYLLAQRAREADLRDQVVLITGGSRGLGFLLAMEFARKGARVAICARSPHELEAARRELAAHGADVFAVPCDVSDRGHVRGMVNEVLRHHGRIDILVNNAGIIQVGPVESMNERDFAKALDVMFWGVLHTTLEVLPAMQARRAGRIVNITSLGGMVSIPHLLPYNCAKFAAVGLSQGLRAELRSSGIKVTTIVPGTMRLGSQMRAEFRGQEQDEYNWFSLAASIPGLSIGGRRAARQIVKATQRGQALRILGLPANILERMHGLFPGVTAEVLSMMDRLLPAGNGSDRGGRRGAELDARIRSGLLRRLTSLGRSAAHRLREFGDAGA